MMDLAIVAGVVIGSACAWIAMMAITHRGKSTPGFSIKASDAQHLETRTFTEQEMPHGIYAAAFFKKGTNKDEAIQFLDETRKGIESGDLFPDQPVMNQAGTL